MKRKKNNISYEDIKEKIRKYITLRIYIVMIGFFSVFYALIGYPVVALVYGLLCFIGVVIHEEYKRKLRI